MKKYIFLLIAFTLIACNETPRSLAVGREWNATRRVVADTMSTFKTFDTFLLQFNYGKNFDFDSLFVEFISQEGNVVYSHKTKVSEKIGDFSLLGKKKGQFLTVADYFKSKKAQTAKIRISSEKGLLIEKEIVIEK